MAINGNKNASPKNAQEAFSGWLDILTPDKLRAQQIAQRQAVLEGRLRTLGPRNTLAMQFGEALGNLIANKAGMPLSPQERQAAANGEVLAQGLDTAMERIEGEGIALGTPEARKIVLEEQFRAAMEQGNLEVADKLHQGLSELAERELRLAKLKAETADIETDNRNDQERLDLMRDQLAAEKREAAARIGAAAAEGEDALRSELDKQILPATEQLAALKSIEELAVTGSAASDVSLIFKFLKVLDPESTVREGEFDNVQKATDYILARVDKGEVSAEAAARLSKLVTGEKFTDYQRANIVNAARASIRSDLYNANERIDQIFDIAQRRDLNLQNVASGNVRLVRHGLANALPIDESTLTELYSGKVSLKNVLSTDSELDSAIMGLE